MIAEAHRSMVGKPGALARGLTAIAVGDADSVDAHAAMIRVAQFIEAQLAPPKG